MPSVQCKTTLFAVKEKKNDLYSLVLYRIQWIKSESSDSFTQTDGNIATCFSTSIAVSCTRRSVAFTASFTCGTSSSHMFGYQTSPRWPCPKQCKSPHDASLARWENPSVSLKCSTLLMFRPSSSPRATLVQMTKPPMCLSAPRPAPRRIHIISRMGGRSGEEWGGRL